MNKLQKRLLLEVEYEFYLLQVGEQRFNEILKSLGYRANARLHLIEDDKLSKLNRSIRTILRSSS